MSAETPLNLDAVKDDFRDLMTSIAACPQDGEPCLKCQERARTTVAHLPALVAEVERLRSTAACPACTERCAEERGEAAGETR
jgi:hypothetical protein